MCSYISFRAANSVWYSDIFEYYCVDESGHMNTLARLLLQGNVYLFDTNTVKFLKHQAHVSCNRDATCSQPILLQLTETVMPIFGIL